MIDSREVHHERPQVSGVPNTQTSHTTAPVTPPGRFPRRHHRVRWTILIITVMAVVLLGAASWVAYRAISVINTKKLDGGKLSFFQQLTRIVTSGGDKLQGETDDRVNILLLGYGGPGHDGPYLTDTMMVISVQPSTKQVALISIPRDLVVDIPGYDYRKINSVLSFGRDQKYPGGGEAFAVNVVRDVLNIPIQYYARVDFDGFKDVIDQVGGITVTVDTAFSDFQYPDNAYGYDPISFKAGQQTMDGTAALKFSRSRHGNNGEGSDFARAARQQKIIVALKEKLLSFGTLSNPKKISDVLGSLGSHSQTNMEIWEMLRLAKMVGGIQSDQIINKVYDDSASGLLRAATGTGGAFILVPRDGNYRNMRFLAQNIFLLGAANRESANILVVNATSFANLGATERQVLLSFGLNALKASTLANASIGQTILVSLRPGQFPATERLLSLYARAAGTIDVTNWTSQTGDTTLAELLSTPITTNTNRVTNSTVTVTPNLIVVLGQDQPKPSTTSSPASTNTNAAASTNNNTTSTNTNTKTTNTNTKVSNTNTSTTNANVSPTNTNVSVTNTNTATSNTNSVLP